MLYPEFEELVAYKDLKIDRGKSYRPSKSQIIGGQHSFFRGQGLEFDSVRKYEPGDDIRNIDWRVTARTGSPHLKIFHEEKERHIVLCVDMNAYMRFGTRNTFKSVQAARITSLLGWQGISHHDQVSVCLFGDVFGGIEFFTPKHSKTSFSIVLKRLSEPIQEKHHVRLIDALRPLNKVARTGSIIYFISDFMNLEDEKESDVLLSSMSQRCDVVFISVNDRADMALVPTGNISVSKGFQRFIVNTDSYAGRKAYELQWLENRKTLCKKTMQFKISLIELTTEDDIKKDLLMAMKRLSKRRHS